MKQNKGFTLIELLVVVAIIGILASVVLASLNSARGKGTDSAIKGELSSLRAQAEIFYDTAGNYGNATTACTTEMFADPTVQKLIASIDNRNGAEAITCESTGSAWATAAELTQGTAGSGWCVDSTGSSKAVATVAGSTAGGVCN